jgi:protein phosphatase
MPNEKLDPASGGSPAGTLQVALRSDVGKVRTENQDFGLVVTPSQCGSSGGFLMIVADGMGGHRGGARASRLAAESVRDRFLEARPAEIADALVSAIQVANAAVFEESTRTAELRGMGTTVSAMVVCGSQAWLAHVGDSRIYRLRGGELEQLTQDHSLVATMMREGLITADEAAVHPRRNVLQRSVGVAEEIEVDRGDAPVEPGDTFLLCSDGLHGFVASDEIRQALMLPVERAAERCIELAHRAGAPDNVTVIVCRAELAPGDHSQKTVEVPVGASDAAGGSPRAAGARRALTAFLFGAAGATFWFWNELRAAMRSIG